MPINPTSGNTPANSQATANDSNTKQLNDELAELVTTLDVLTDALKESDLESLVDFKKAYPINTFLDRAKVQARGLFHLVNGRAS
jgi:hypothetical protein